MPFTQIKGSHRGNGMFVVAEVMVVIHIYLKIAMMASVVE